MSGQVGEAFKFQISGFIGTTLFYFAYEYLFSLLSGVNYGGLIAWVVSYTASIWWQFELHRFIVFDIKGSYWKALGTTYLVYSTSLVASSIMNYILVDIVQMHYRIAWGVTVVSLGIINFYVLRSSFGKK